MTSKHRGFRSRVASGLRGGLGRVKESAGRELQQYREKARESADERRRLRLELQEHQKLLRRKAAFEELEARENARLQARKAAIYRKTHGKSLKRRAGEKAGQFLYQAAFGKKRKRMNQ